MPKFVLAAAKGDFRERKASNMSSFSDTYLKLKVSWSLTWFHLSDNIEIAKPGEYTPSFPLFVLWATLLSNFEAQIRQKHLRGMAPLK